MQKFQNAINIIIKILLVVLLIFIILGIVGIKILNDKLAKVNYQPIQEEKIEVNNGVQLENKGYRNIAIFGVDSREDSYEDTRSDGIIIASINEETKDVKLFSVYRDSYLEIDGHGLDKVTHAYAYGGAELAINTLNKNLDLDIKEFISVNFEAVIDIINEVGGIELDIEQAEIPYINSWGNGTKIIKSGKNLLNGSQALAYARIRSTAGGDYKRTERMRNVLIATFDKAKGLNIKELNNILNTLLPEVSTNITINDMREFIANALNYKIDTSMGWPYEVKGLLTNRWYGVPVSLEKNVKRLHQELFNEINYEPSDKVKEINQTIIDKTGIK